MASAGDRQGAAVCLKCRFRNRNRTREERGIGDSMRLGTRVNDKRVGEGYLRSRRGGGSVRSAAGNETPSALEDLDGTHVKRTFRIVVR